MVVIVAILIGAGFGLGLYLLITGLRPPVPATPAQDYRRPGAPGFQLPPGLKRQLALAAGGAAAMGLLTRWPVGVLGGAALGAFLPSLCGGQAAREDAIARTEAIATWTEMLRDSLAGAHGLEEVITTTAPIAPAPVRSAVIGLAHRLSHQRLPDALRQMADELADPTADLVVLALILAAQGSPRELGDLLGTLAIAARDEAAMHRRVEATRARARSTVQVVTVLTVTMMLGLLVFNANYLDPYRTATGQLVLALVAGLFGTGLWWLSRMARFVAPERVLAGRPRSDVGETR